MQARILRFGTALGVALAALGLLAVSIALAAPTENSIAASGSQDSAHRAGFVVEGHRTGPVIYARRRISIPFGISEDLSLIAEGRAVVVTGHVGCTGEQSFELRVMVKQQGTPTVVGHGTTQGSCTDSSWEAIATAEGQASFETGEARVCGEARVPNLNGRTVTRHWCKDVQLH
ncbi:MAG: hypothetical protein M5U01_20775 [Ardenticatenaceae bacterium]|nr:hypothetical protein [Ardenticatenaceae bacterium]HBY96680.1 hypothetical protein [Chloroflexota bacterium]